MLFQNDRSLFEKNKLGERVNCHTQMIGDPVNFLLCQILINWRSPFITVILYVIEWNKIRSSKCHPWQVRALVSGHMSLLIVTCTFFMRSMS